MYEKSYISSANLWRVQGLSGKFRLEYKFLYLLPCLVRGEWAGGLVARQEPPKDRPGIGQPNPGWPDPRPRRNGHQVYRGFYFFGRKITIWIQ